MAATGTVAQIVTTAELSLYQMAADAGIAPQIVKINESDGKITLITESIPQTLVDVFRENPILAAQLVERTQILVKDLQNLGIIHADLSNENILYDAVADRIYLTNFKKSRLYSAVLEEFRNNIDCLEYVKSMQIKMIRSQC